MINIWDYTTSPATHEAKFSGNTKWFMCCDISPSGRYVAAGGLNNAVDIYATGSSEFVLSLDMCFSYVAVFQWVTEETMVVGTGDGVLWYVQIDFKKKAFWSRKLFTAKSDL